MSLPEKSSDEILKELFGMCLKSQTAADYSSEPESSIQSNEDVEKKHKYKKKKKKHKSEKKRKRNSSIESSICGTTHISKKAKSTKENEEPDNTTMCIKIKSEKVDDVSSSEVLQKKSVVIKSEVQAPNFMDVLTGQKLTIDDVFNSIGITTGNSYPIKMKKEKDIFDTIEKKKLDAENVPKIFDELDLEKKEDNDILSNKRISEVFSDNKTDVPKCGPKKIKIKNLKNSTVYEATIKEVEEREKLRIEKYEEGELSSSSNKSDSEYLKDISDKDIKYYDSGAEKGFHCSKHKKRLKSDEKTEKKRHLRKKKKHSKSSHESSKRSADKLVDKDRDHRREKSFAKNHYEHRHLYHRSHDRRHSSDSEPQNSISRRPHDSRLKKHRRSRECSRSRSRNKRKSSKQRSKSKSPEKIDKQKLLEIARKNAINLIKQGALPASVIANKDKIAGIKAGGKTVDELTDFCKQLSKKDADSHNLSSSESDVDSDNGKDKPFHHPFQLKERPSSIVMNIRNAVPLPTKTAQEKTLELSKQLSLQYPVSSGQQHRKTENEWVPVVREESTVSKASSKIDSNALVCYSQQKNTTAVPRAAPLYPTTIAVATTAVPQRSDIDIGSVVAQRLEAIRRLTENPQDPIGNNLIRTVDTKMQVWAESKVQPGLFTGSTGVRTLSAAELSSGFKAWPKKNQLIATKPIHSDKGEALMKKMGWQPGEGLGKYKQGPAAPCEINMKTDRKGLAEQQQPKVFIQPNTLQKAFEITQNKHPVSLLNEYCSRKKLCTPQYDCEEREGAARKKLFMFSVTVQGARYTPKMPSTNKKQSKVEAATVCLQSLGLLPVINPSAS